MTASEPNETDQRRALVDALLADQDAIASEVRAQIQAQLPAYEPLPGEALEREVGVQIERVLASVRDGEGTTPELVDLSEIGEARAQQGVPIDEMLRAWRIGVQVVIERARDVGSELGIEPAEVLDMVQSTLAMSDHAMLKTAGGHRHAELELVRQDSERRAAFVRAVLSGTLTSADARTQAPGYGLDPTAEFVCVRGRAAEDSSRQALERALGFHEAAQHRRGLATVIEGDLAGFLLEPPTRAVPGVVGLGPPRPLDALADSFRFATRALSTADSFGLEGIHDLKSLGLRSAIAADPDLGEALSERYLKPLGATGSGDEIIASLRVYFAMGMHVERAAEQLFVHPNTLRYRIARFEELTDASLRDPVAAFEVWWALEHSSMGPESGQNEPA